MTAQFSITVENVPDYAYDKPYIVAKVIDGEFWFYGAWDDEDKARAAAEDIRHDQNIEAILIDNL